MKTHHIILFMIVSSMVFVSCRKADPQIEPEQLSLSVTVDKGRSVLNWSKAEDEGFEKYWLIRVPFLNTEITDTFQIRNSVVLFETRDPDSTWYKDVLLNFSSAMGYQVFALVNGILYKSKTVENTGRSFVMNWEKDWPQGIAGGGGRVFAIDYSATTLQKKAIVVFNPQTGVIENQIEIESPFGYRAALAHGDFGNGETELVISNSWNFVNFYDPITLALKHSEPVPRGLKAMLDFPGQGLMFLNYSTDSLLFFSRNDDVWIQPDHIEGFGTSEYTFSFRIPGKNEFLVNFPSNDLARFSWDGNIRFTQQNKDSFPVDSVKISLHLAVDPKGKHFIPAKGGQVYRLSDFSWVHTLDKHVDSIGRIGDFRTWAYSTSGDWIVAGSTHRPVNISIYNADDFSVEERFDMPNSEWTSRTVILDGTVYLLTELDNDKTRFTPIR